MKFIVTLRVEVEAPDEWTAREDAVGTLLDWYDAAEVVTVAPGALPELPP